MTTATGDLVVPASIATLAAAVAIIGWFAHSDGLAVLGIALAAFSMGLSAGRLKW